MAQRKKQKNVLSGLAETGEDALQRLVELPGGSRLVEAGQALRARVDELQKRVRSLDPLERRVAELERRLDELTKPKTTRRTAAGHSAGTRKPAARLRRPSAKS